MSKASKPEFSWSRAGKILETAVEGYNTENSSHGEIELYQLDFDGASAVYEISRRGSEESYLLRVEKNIEKGHTIPDLRNDYNIPEKLYAKIVRHTCMAIQEEYPGL